MMPFVILSSRLNQHSQQTSGPPQNSRGYSFLFSLLRAESQITAVTKPPPLLLQLLFLLTQNKTKAS